MPFFTFERASATLKAAKYLSAFDDTVRFTLTSTPAEQTLYLTTGSIRPFCYTDFSFQVATTAPPAKRQAREEERIGWAVNSDLLVRVLGCFDPALELTFEIEEDDSFLLLMQQTPDAIVTRVMRIGVIHDLGPSLSVDHDIENLYCIEDIDSFRQVARSATISDDPSCHISLFWGLEDDKPKKLADGFHRAAHRGDTCYLRMTTSSAKFLVQLGALDRPLSASVEGCVQCADMETFGLLCERTSRGGAASQANQRRQPEQPAGDQQQLSVGFGHNGLSLLRLRWMSSRGESTANLFFCTN